MTVIYLDQYRIQIQNRRKTLNTPECRHKKLLLDEHGGTVECQDCGVYLSPFNAFVMTINDINKIIEKINRQIAENKNVAEKQIVLRAAQKAQSAWRSKTMVPMCPHCHEPIFPNDGFGGKLTNKKMAMRRREKTP